MEIPGIENINVTELVPGHMAYRTKMPRLLREVGWMVESDEFSEIEDPDPENHERRQRELINEIEEARKQLEKKPEKRRFGIFKAKKYAEKKEWETYDEKTKGQQDETDADAVQAKDAGVLFDVDAIRAEAAELAAQGFHVKELDSTLPPMVLKSPALDTHSTLRETKSFDDGLASARLASPSTSSLPQSANGHRGGPQPARYDYDEIADARKNSSGNENISLSFEPSSTASPTHHSPTPTPKFVLEAPTQRPPLTTSISMPVSSQSLEHNAWADDDDDFGQEKEMQMTFE